jgi:hypothetical protein
LEPRGELVNYIAGPCREVRRKDMGSSREYWLYAKECARWAAETKNKEDQDLFIDMAKAWTNIAIVEADVTKVAARELSKKSTN